MRVRASQSAAPSLSLSPLVVGLRGCLSAAGAFSVHAQVLAALDNPYIIQYCDSFIDQDQLNIVMEYAAAGNLHEVSWRCSEGEPRARTPALAPHPGRTRGTGGSRTWGLAVAL